MTFKKKNIILLMGALLLLLLSWNLAISETVNLRTKVSQAEVSLFSVERAPQEIANLKYELGKIQGNTKMLYSGILPMREALLSEITELAYKYDSQLRGFPEFFIQEKEDFELTTSPVVLEGKFENLLKLMNDFEERNSTGKISSAHFEVKRSLRKRDRKLFLTLYIQSINI
jgi:hypothetical protein